MSALNWLLISVAGCVASEPLSLPVDPSARTVLFAIREADQVARIFAFDPNDVPPLSLGDEELFLISYPFELAELGLTEGAQPTVGDQDPARPLPPGYSAFRLDDDRDAWTPLSADELEGVLGERALIDVPSCPSPAGCIRRREPSYQFCELPCDAPPAPIPPAAPTPPALPLFEPCPAGWISRPSITADATYCEPPALEACQPGSTHFIGDSGCARVGSSCPADGWPAVLPGGRTVHYVAPGGGGDGTSKASPFGTIAQALAIAASSDVIALAEGSHAGGVVLDRSLAIVGACAGSVIAGGSPAILVGANGDVDLSDLAIAATGDGLEIDGTASLFGVTISGGDRGALVRGTLIGRELLVRGTREGGLVATNQAVIRVSRAELADNISYGASLEGASNGRFTDVVVRGSLSHPSNAFEKRGYGLIATSGSRLVVTRALLEQNRGNAIAAWYSSTASITHIVDRDGLGQYSFDLDTEAIGEASYLVSLRAQEGSVWAFRLGDATVADVYTSGGSGGLYAREGGRIRAKRVLLEANTGVGVESSSGGNVSIEDLTIRDQMVGTPGTGEGLVVNAGSIVGSRIQIVRPTGFGVDVTSTMGQGSVTLTDLHVAGVRLRTQNDMAPECRRNGSGLRATNGTNVHLTRAFFEGGERGMSFDSFDQHTLRDVLIRRAARTGLCASNGVYDVANLRIEEVGGRGIDLFGGYFEASDLAVLTTKKIEGVDPNEPNGVGVFLSGRNELNDVRIAVFPVSKFLLAGNQTRGLLMDNGSQAMLQDGEIAGSEVGIELIRQPAFDLTTLYENVIFRNNGTHVACCDSD